MESAIRPLAPRWISPSERAKKKTFVPSSCSQMYDDIAKNRGIIRPNCVISLQRPEWQQPTDAFPPLNKRLAGQRRRRLLGSFPQTENDVRSSRSAFSSSIFFFFSLQKIGWRLLPEQAIEIRTGNKVRPLPSQYKFSRWPIESFY